MKSSPIFSTTCAVAIMLAGYIVMQFSLKQSVSALDKTTVHTDATLAPDSPARSAFLELHFSTPPKSIVLTDPLSNRVITRISDLTDHEWSGEINLPPRADLTSLELAVKADWNEASNNENTAQHFIQLTLSPDQQDVSSVTLRSFEAIDTAVTFHWK